MQLSRRVGGTTFALSAPRVQGLLYLHEAYVCAAELGATPLEFSCQLDAMLRNGISETTLRWLLAQGLAEHHLETTGPRKVTRTFRKAASRRFEKASCFILSAAGRDFLERYRLDAAHALAGPNTARPHFDVATRTLYLGESIVKEFKVPAANQELILTCFEEEGWPTHLDDPLGRVPNVDPKKRLLDAVYRLNTNQRERLIRFEGNGRGTGLLWKPVEPNETR